jgi:hypothetical protein
MELFTHRVQQEIGNHVALYAPGLLCVRFATLVSKYVT